MIDCHSHILPNIDDGALSMDEAIQMVKLAIADGVTTQVLTPHIHPDRYSNDCENLRWEFELFEGVIKDSNLAIDLILSAEFRICPSLMQTVQQADMLWLGEWQGKKAILLEFPHSNIPVGSINFIKWFVKENIVPVIAHPERNRELLNNPDKLKPYLDEGCLLQVTASSLTGGFGRDSVKYATQLLKQGVVNFLATDCHNTKYRPPGLSAGVNVAVDIIGEIAAKKLVIDNPQQLLSNKFQAA